jgi:hypothetical protein
MNCKSEMCDEGKFGLKLHETCKIFQLYCEHMNRMFNAFRINLYLCEVYFFPVRSEMRLWQTAKQAVPVSPLAENAFDFLRMNHIIESYTFKFNLELHGRTKTDDILRTQHSYHDPYIEFLQTLFALIVKFLIKKSRKNLFFQ